MSAVVADTHIVVQDVLEIITSLSACAYLQVDNQLRTQSSIKN